MLACNSAPHYDQPHHEGHGHAPSKATFPGSSFGMFFLFPPPNGCFSAKRHFLRKRALFWKLAFSWDLVHNGVKQQDCGQTIRPHNGRNSPHKDAISRKRAQFQEAYFLAVPVPFEVDESGHFLSKRHSFHENGRICFRSEKTVQLEDPGFLKATMEFGWASREPVRAPCF